MHIAILETGRTNSAMPEKFRDYPDLFLTSFKTDKRFADFTFSVVPVMDGVFPDNVQDYDGYLVTGSKTGVYDAEPWIAPLQDFIRAIHDHDIPLVGVCFGHQIIAHALGGYAAKSSKGWGLGIHDVPLANKPDWISGGDDIRLIHVHQDQVEELPEGATLIGSTDFCPIAMYTIGDKVFSMQGHPEFTVEYTDALLGVKAETMGPDRVADARTTFPDGHDGPVVAGWIMNFFQNHSASAANRIDE